MQFVLLATANTGLDGQVRVTKQNSPNSNNAVNPTHRTSSVQKFEMTISFEHHGCSHFEGKLSI